MSRNSFLKQLLFLEVQDHELYKNGVLYQIFQYTHSRHCCLCSGYRWTILPYLCPGQKKRKVHSSVGSLYNTAQKLNFCHPEPAQCKEESGGVDVICDPGVINLCSSQTCITDQHRYRLTLKTQNSKEKRAITVFQTPGNLFKSAVTLRVAFFQKHTIVSKPP